MSEFEDKLQSILGNSEAMGQIMSIAQALTGGGQEQGGQETAPTQPEQDSTQEQAAPVQPAAPPAAGASPLSFLGDLDPRLVQMGIKLLSEYNSGDDRKVALLSALRPFVKEERYAKVDKAVQIAKLSRVIRVALETFKKGDAGHV